MHHHPYSRAVEERTYVNRAVYDAHAWLVEHCQHIEDDHGVQIPVDFYQLARMRQVKVRYGEWRAHSFGDGSKEQSEAWDAYFTPSEVERRMMDQYDILMHLYANRPLEGEAEPSRFGSWALIVAVLLPWLMFAIWYGIWRWHH